MKGVSDSKGYQKEDGRKKGEKTKRRRKKKKEKVSNHRRLVVDGNSLLHHRSPVNSLEEWMALLGVALKQLLQD